MLGYTEGEDIVTYFRWAALSRWAEHLPTQNQIANAANQYRALPGVRGKGMASRTLARPVT